jgi:hypothetical protein
MTESMALDQSAQCEDSLATGITPAHPGAFHPLPDEGFAGGLDHARADGEVLGCGGGISHACPVTTKVAQDLGDTLAARVLARTLGRPLLILDLAAVMSSFLGRTGGNLRHVLDYAKSIECVLLLDELDAIAKRRDDAGEIGELKRLVTVLIQEIDDWPSSGLLVAATNHPELLDPAIWRRFFR